MKVAAIGEILVDMTRTHEDANGICHFAANPDGAPANVAVGLSKLGCQTAFAGCVGDDEFGRILIRALKRHKVDTRFLSVMSQASTTLAVVSVDENADRSFSFCRNPGADSLISLECALQAAEYADILHFGSFSLSCETCREIIRKALERAKTREAVISYDPNFRKSVWSNFDFATSTIREFLKYCDILKISFDELALVSDKANMREAAKDLIRWHCISAVLIILERTVPFGRIRADQMGMCRQCL